MTDTDDAVLGESHTTPSRAPAHQWLKALAPYKDPSLKRSIVELVITVVPFIALWAAAVSMSFVSYFLTIPICVVAAFFLVRLFLIQHDCSHGAFFKSRKANDWVDFGSDKEIEERNRKREHEIQIKVNELM